MNIEHGGPAITRANGNSLRPSNIADSNPSRVVRSWLRPPTRTSKLTALYPKVQKALATVAEAPKKSRQSMSWQPEHMIGSSFHSDRNHHLKQQEAPPVLSLRGPYIFALLCDQVRARRLSSGILQLTLLSDKQPCHERPNSIQY